MRQVSSVRFPPIADVEPLKQHRGVKWTIRLMATAASICVSGCQRSLPPLLQGASSKGGIGYGCAELNDPASPPGPQFTQSPEMVERLRKEFPPGSPSKRIEASLQRQGFTLNGACSSDRTVHSAQFRGNRNEVVANVYWRQTPDGRVIWTFGDVAYTFL